MPYHKPGQSAQIFPGGPPVTFPLGGYTADYFGTDITVGKLNVYTPSAVIGNARQGALVFLPDPSRYQKAQPAKGFPPLIIPNGASWLSLPPRYNIVPDETTSNLLHRALDAGFIVVWGSIAGPGGPYPSDALGHGTEDVVATSGTGFLPADYQHYDGPGSLPLVGGTEYAHDRYLTYRKQGQWLTQWFRRFAKEKKIPANLGLIYSCGTSAGADVAYAMHAMPDLADPAMADFRSESSRVVGCGLISPPFWTPALKANEANVYGRYLPRNGSPLTLDCEATGWVGAPSPSGIVYASELTLERLAFGGFAVSDGVGERWPGAPTHEELIEQTKTMRVWTCSASEPLNYGIQTPTQICAMSGVGQLRTLTNFGKMLAATGTGFHSPAWQLQMAQRHFELDGSTDPTGFQRRNFRWVAPQSVYDLLAGHTTTGDANAPYGPIPLQDLVAAVTEDVEESFNGVTDGFCGFLGNDFVAWLVAQCLEIDPTYADPPPDPVIPRVPYSPVSPQGYSVAQARLLPPGSAWRLAPESLAEKLLTALGDEPSRVAQRVADLLREADPSQTTELLTEWEQVLGLPDPCVIEEQTVGERKQAVVAKLSTVGGQTPAFYVELAAALGYEVDVEEYFPIDCETGHCEDFLYGPEWLHHFGINAPGNTVSLADCENSTCEDFLASWGNEPLVCAIARAKPAHTHVVFIEH